MRRARIRRAAAVWVGSGALWLAGCASPGESGELLYRKGDLCGAIDAWRADDADALAPRIAAVEAEIDARVKAHIANANALQREGRLAEALLDYRLALELRPDDQPILDHVQRLAREIIAQRAVLVAAYREVREQGDLPAATEELAKLRRLDPFEPAYETEQLRLQAAIDEELRARQARARAARKAQVESLVEAGRAAFGDEQLEAALDLWRRALMIDPENERVQAYIARAEQQLQTLEQFRATQRDGGA
jgi:tetratricopeptide (TPR) repeat protein